jgi:DNA-binding response OmpR family regulator
MPDEAKPRFNLETLEVLLLDETEMGLAILAQLVKGLGVRRILRCETVDQAKQTILGHGPDFAIIDALTDGRGYELVRWIRTETSPPHCYLPILMTAGHTPQDDVAEAMNCGIDYLIKKPIAPRVLMERIAWICRAERAFVYSDTYVGPERRGPRKGPGGVLGDRRAPSAPAEPGPDATDDAPPPRQTGHAS